MKIQVSYLNSYGLETSEEDYDSFGEAFNHIRQFLENNSGASVTIGTYTKQREGA